MNDKERLLELLKDKSLEVRPVTLSSGKISDYYMDCKRVTLSPEGAYLTGKLMLEMIRPEVSAVGGLTLGADPIVSSISVLSHLQKRDMAGLIVRKEPKKHGTMSYVEGPALQRERWSRWWKTWSPREHHFSEPSIALQPQATGLCRL